MALAIKSGPYDDDERKAVEKAAESVASGEREFRAAVQSLAAELHRSERGLALLMGRMVRRAGGTFRADPQSGISPRIANLLGTIKTLSRKRRQLAARRDALNGQIADVDRRLAQLTPRLMTLTGLPEHFAAADDDDGQVAGQ